MGVYEELANLENKSPTPVDQPVSDKEKKKVSKLDKPVSKNTTRKPKKPKLQDDFEDLLKSKASETTTFRISPSLLEQIDDIQYLLKSRYKTKVTRYSLLAVALVVLFQDYRENKDSSIVVQKLIKNK